MKKPKISIITACYNSQSTIRDTIESVVNQSYDNFEYIIIDGKSKDDTLKVVDKYKEVLKDKLIVVSEKDKGIFDAMNKGISKASGDIIGILNSDDVLATNQILEKIANEFSNNKCDICYGNLLFMDENLKKVNRVWIAKKGNVKLGWHPPHPTLYLSKKVYKEIGNFNLKFRIAADLDLMYRIFSSKKYKTSYIKENIVLMRTGGVSTNGLKGYLKNLKEANLVYKENNNKLYLLINIKRIFITIKQRIYGVFYKNS